MARLVALGGLLVAAGALALVATGVVAMSLADEPRRASYAKCRPCGHVFVYAYLPMRVDEFVRCMKRATCPMCGAPAKQLDVFSPGLTPDEAATR